MKATDFGFHLPDSLIAFEPVIPRDECRLLVLRRDGIPEHRKFCDLPGYLNKGDLLLLNDTRVFPARLDGKKQTGGKIEILLVREIEHNTWEILSRERYSGMVYISDELSGEMFGGETIRFKFNYPECHHELDSGSEDMPKQVRHDSDTLRLMETLWKTGLMPLPPYIKRKPSEADKDWYQTVYAEKVGSIAAPTAGLHFTGELIDNLNRNGVIIRHVTLHIGAGTFKPVRAGEVEDHRMEPEHFEIEKDLVETIKTVKKSGKRVIAVGTTTTRAIEGYISGRYENSSEFGLPVRGTQTGVRGSELKSKIDDSAIRIPHSATKSSFTGGTTDIFIYPGYEFKIVDSLITNFHLPESTPLMLTAAFCGSKKLLKAYGSAISMGYRFFSYGDAMLIL